MNPEEMLIWLSEASGGKEAMVHTIDEGGDRLFCVHSAIDDEEGFRDDTLDGALRAAIDAVAERRMNEHKGGPV